MEPARVLDWYRTVRAIVVREGYQHEIDWAQTVKAPEDAEALAREAIYVICNSGMKAQVARPIFERIMLELVQGRSANGVFKHRGKADAIDWVWAGKVGLLRQYLDAEDKVAWCETIPFIGSITKWHLAKNLGANVVKPDRHLVRIAQAMGAASPDELCSLIASGSKDLKRTVDTVIWRACNLGFLDPCTASTK